MVGQSTVVYLFHSIFRFLIADLKSNLILCRAAMLIINKRERTTRLVNGLVDTSFDNFNDKNLNDQSVDQ